MEAVTKRLDTDEKALECLFVKKCWEDHNLPNTTTFRRNLIRLSLGGTLSSGARFRFAERLYNSMPTVTVNLPSFL